MLAFGLQWKGGKGQAMTFLLKYEKWILVIGAIMLHAELGAEFLDFGRVRINSQQLDTLLFKNENMVTMMISKTTITDTVFALPSYPFTGALSQLEPDEEIYLPIVFTPKSINRYSSQFIVETNLGNFNWSLMGAGVEEVVVINEILADPAANLAGDANGDGIRNSNEDEFVELLNTGKYPIDIGGWQLFDAGASQSNRLTFPPTTWMDPNEYVVVFGGGTPQGITGKFFVDDGRIGGGLRNSGDELLLFDPTKNDTLALIAYGTEGNKNVSLVRWPEGVGQWYLHTEFPGNDMLFSPGKVRTVVLGIEMVNQDTAVVFGDSLHLSVRKLWSDGSTQPVLDGDLSWHTLIENILIQDDDGIWIGKQAGSVQIYSEFRGFISDTLSISVLPPRVVRLNVTLGDSLLLIGNAYDLIVEGVISETEKTILSDGYQIVVSDTSIIHLNDRVVEARSLGTGEVTVTRDGLSTSLQVKVVAYGDLNADGEHTLWDAVRMVHLILGIEPEGNTFEWQSADLTQDGDVDIRDLIGVIQKIFGDEGVSNKPARLKSFIGLQENASGVSLSIPPQTVAITFNVNGADYNNGITTSSGQVYLEKGEREIEGVILLKKYENFDWQGQKVDVTGVFDFDGAKWVAWTLDGSGYVLMSQNRDNGKMALIDASPNPLNPSTTINYSIPVAQEITLSVYNATGQWVDDLYEGYVLEGVHKVVWNGQDAFGRSVASGLYFAHLKGPFDAATIKMVVLR